MTWPEEIFLLIGQSNMAGRGRASGVATHDPRIQAWTRADDWAVARDPLHWDKPEAGVGPGLGFASALLAVDPSRRIGLVPAAVGGTAVALWMPTIRDPVTGAFPYDDAVRRTRRALRFGRLCGILWHQGEADRGCDGRQSYPQRLTDLIERLRVDLQAADVPVVAGELPHLDPAVAEDTAAFNTMLHGLETSIRRFSVASAGGLCDGGDRLHLDAQSAREFGRRYALTFLGMHDV